MRTYESIVILHPELAGDELTATVEKITGLLEEQQAEILKVDNWGTRKLAYLVKKQARGTYVLLVFNAAAEVIAEYERRLRLDEKVIKFQTVYLENGYVEAPAKSEPAETEAAAAAESADESAEAEA